jgi:predicted transposase/invertase (TIGR01784 family)
LAKKFITDDKEYNEVMKMIENSALDFKGILGRNNRIVYEEGIEKGIERGIEEGKIISNHEIAIKLINLGYDDTEIKTITKLNQKEINKLKQENSID